MEARNRAGCAVFVHGAALKYFLLEGLLVDPPEAFHSIEYKGNTAQYQAAALCGNFSPGMRCTSLKSVRIPALLRLFLTKNCLANRSCAIVWCCPGTVLYAHFPDVAKKYC
jgi:hypothetical protein